jgi:hypothetical protein
MAGKLITEREMFLLEGKSIIDLFKRQRKQYLNIAKSTYSCAKEISNGKEPNQLSVAGILCEALKEHKLTYGKFAATSIDITNKKIFQEWRDRFARFILSETYEQVKT